MARARKETLQDLVRTKIENLRPKLLDLSRRNPLISTKLGPRSNSHIRAVDELPDVLFFELNNGQEMTLIPLPPIEEDPRDEKTEAFREALINARLTNEAYIASMEQIDRDADDYVEKTRIIDRALRDQVREQLGLEPRVQRVEINLTQHAKNNGILPSYELPKANEQNPDGRHTDDRIQTLLLPDDLERKLNAIIAKSRTWITETGINVLHVAFGFLEWSDSVQTDSSFAPLILLQVQLRKTRTPQGPKFSIESAGDEPELNAVLAEKLRIDFAVEIPKFDGSSVETYLAAITEILPKKRQWRVRRQVAIGVFPSARMAMYHDIDPKQQTFPQSDIVQSLLAGNEAAGDSPFADEYDVDEPEIERKVPCLVMDADSSQFSTLVDIGDGKNLAVEGPPGTGKSQTIVNAIAAALGEGKKVLFVAEKLAALNVVKSRLEAAELGEFLLPLQAEKSTREQVMDSIRARLDMRDTRAVRDYDERIKEFQRIRKQLADYVDLITTEFSDSGLTVHEILGKSIATNPRLEGLSTEILERCKLDANTQTVGGLSNLVQSGLNIERSHAETLKAQKTWRATKLINPDRFTIEEACSIAKRAAEEAIGLAQARDALVNWGLEKSESIAVLEGLERCLATSADHLNQHTKDFLIAVIADGMPEALSGFIAECATVNDAEQALVLELTEEPDDASLQKVRKVEEICDRASLWTIDSEALAEELEARKKSAHNARAISAAIQPFVAAHEAACNWVFDDLSRAYALYREAGRDALLLRNEAHSDDGSVYHLRRFCEEGMRLQAERDALSGRVLLSVEISSDALVQCASTLRTAGMFSFLWASYRSAKRVAKSILRSGKFVRADAVRCVDDFIAFRRKSNEFGSQARASGMFGLHDRGLDTNFEPFSRLARFLGALDEHFGSPQQLELRRFMREAPTRNLDLLPGLPTTGVTITYNSLQGRITSADEEAKVLNSAIAELREVAGVFRNSEIEPAVIKDTKLQLEKFLSGRRSLDQHAIARNLLGERFNGHRTNILHFKDVVGWAQAAKSYSKFVRIALARGNPQDAAKQIAFVLASELAFKTTLSRLADVAKIEPTLFLQGKLLRDGAAELHKASEDGDGLFAYATFATALLEAGPNGILPLVEERLRGGSLADLGAQLEALAVRRMAKAVYSKFGNKLTKFRGTELDKLRATLAQKDKEIIALSRRQLRARVKAAARPSRGNGVGRKSTWTGMALIENEISKKQKYIPVRDLTQRAGNALIELKPCWMMSPLAVAQYVPKGSIQFDLCIIDEASQMPPESAIGALLRCNQAVVVGDTNQLPPSSFFKTLIDDEEADDDESVLSESVLELANGAFRPARRLRWHYRSRHSGLIKFSNRLVYDDDLIVFPSATESLSRMGVEFKAVKGRYKAGTNPIEAKAVVEAVIDFMQNDPERSLGVVTLNQKQRDLITEEFEYAIANNRAVQRYVDTWEEKNDGLEYFFIKNLENVQGDERDVIFIGTVYGAEEPGARVMQRFGPINGLAGKRRLNVLFTRAKQKIVTFSSMTAADIEADEHSNPGPYMLKRWLEYSAGGVLDAGEETEREPDSDFEVFVIDQIRAMGCKPVPQVGVAGYFVDIGIRHPDWPHGFVLGVECDGATYHTAKSARDRDRLRQEVLENLGWRLHRIWSTDWFNNPRQEAEKLRAIIAARLLELKAREREYVQMPKGEGAPPPSSRSELARLDMDLIEQEQLVVPLPSPPRRNALSGHRVEIGDTVRVRYLTDDKRTIRITISNAQSDPSRGIVHHRTPAATALLGAEEGDEVEVLVGSYIRPAVVESIQKTSTGGH